MQKPFNPCKHGQWTMMLHTKWFALVAINSGLLSLDIVVPFVGRTLKQQSVTSLQVSNTTREMENAQRKKTYQRHSREHC